MLDRRRKTLALTFSLLAHATVFGWGELRLWSDIEVPDIEFEFTEVELLDPDMLQGDQAGEPEAPPVVEPPPPPPAPPDEGKAEEDTKAEEEPPPEEPKEPEHHLGKRKSKVDELGPTNSTFYALLVPKKIRKLPFREQAMDIMAPLPDFDYLIGKGGFDALQDFDHIVIASPDIRDMTQTFLAVDYRLSQAEVMAAIERAAAASEETIQWIEADGITRGNPRPIDPEQPDLDPRWFVLLDNKIAIYVRREFLPHILAAETGEEKTAGNYVANLAKLRRFAARQPTAGLQLVMKDIRAALKRARGLPFEPPDSIEVTAEAAEEPELMIRVGFLTAVDAKGAEKFWREDLSALIDKNLTLKLSAKWIYDLLELERNGKELRLWGRFTTGQAETVLQLLADFSAKVLRKSPEEVAEARAQRLENWKKREGGKLPPSALIDDGATSPEPGKAPPGVDAPTEAGSEPGSPPAPTAPSAPPAAPDDGV